MKRPRKKANVPEGFLPVPSKLQATPNAASGRKKELKRFVCRGVLQRDRTVTVSAPGDMDVLYKMGCYGKGSLSRHEPVFHNVVNENIECIEKHMSCRVSMERYSCSVHTSVRAEPIHSERVTPQRFVDMYPSAGDEDVHYLRDTKRREAGPDSEDAHLTDNCVQETGSTMTVLQPTFAVSLDSQVHMSRPEKNFTKSSFAMSSPPQPSSHMKMPCEGKQSAGNMEPSYDDWDEKEPDSAIYSSDISASRQVVPLGVQELSHPVAVFEAMDDSAQKSEAAGCSKTMDNSPQDNEAAVCSIKDDVCQPKEDEECSGDESYSSDSSDDEHLPLSDDQEDTGEDKSKYYQAKEHLVLDPCEAIFLKLAFNCLHITDDTNNEDVSLQDMWKKNVEADKSFIPRYAVYHHCRAKGWVAKDGLNYGCDFMLYKKGPKYFHSSLGIIIRCCEAGSLKEIEAYNNRSFTWAKLMGLNKVIDNVRKELMICYVMIPHDLSEENLSSPEICLRRLTICETLLNKLNPSRERDKDNNAKPKAILSKK